jgi:hypothetical protein
MSTPPSLSSPPVAVVVSSRPEPPAVARAAPISSSPVVTSPPEPPAVALAAPVPPVSNARCEAVARQRTEDAAASGLDRETQEIVRRGAYADCAAWDAAHPQ